MYPTSWKLLFKVKLISFLSLITEHRSHRERLLPASSSSKVTPSFPFSVIVHSLLDSLLPACSAIAEIYLVFCPIGTPAHHHIMPSLLILAHGGARTTETELDEPKAWENDGLRRLSRALL